VWALTLGDPFLELSDLSELLDLSDLAELLDLSDLYYSHPVFPDVT
jgi:hypothetical protein